MPLRLRNDLHWCESGGRIIFLDVTRDRYFCLPSEAKDSFLALAAGEAEAKDAERLNLLTTRGLLVAGGPHESFPQPPLIERPTHDCLRYPIVRSGAVPILRALAWECRTAWQLRTRTFSDVIARARRRGIGPSGPAGPGEPTMRSIAAAAEAIAFVTRSHNRCLVRGLAVHAACRARGIRTKLVLGVIAHPFAAHCWVQFEDAVLVGGYEHARLFTPILVIE